MCVSRFSIGAPADAGGEDVPLDADLAFHGADQSLAGGLNRQQPCDRLAALGDHDALGIDPVEQREALLLELRGSDGLHGQMIRLVTSSVYLGGHNPFASASWRSFGCSSYQ